MVSNSRLDEKITVEEVIKGILQLSNGKSPGEDGILIEMLKSARAMLVPYLIILFNTISDSGQYIKTIVRCGTFSLSIRKAQQQISIRLEVFPCCLLLGNNLQNKINVLLNGLIGCGVGGVGPVS